MKGIMRKQTLRTAFCLLLVITMFVTILPESAQAAVSTPGFTVDLTDLEASSAFRSCGKAGAGGAFFIGLSFGIPEGEDVYVLDSRQACEGMTVYRVFYEGRVWKVLGSDIVDLKDSKYNTAYSLYWWETVYEGKKVKVKKTVIAGDVTKPYNYYYVYAKPKETAENCIGAVLVGDSIEVINEKYNSKWAQILWNGECLAYMKRDCLNSKDAYLAGASRGNQLYIKQAKKAKLTYSGILKKYDKTLTKAEYCRLAVNWYEATGHKLPKQSTKSPYADTKDPYVIMAYQLGIVQKTSDKLFKPDEKINKKKFNAQMKRLLKIAKEPEKLYNYMCADDTVSRETAILAFYRSYRMLQKKDYLMAGVGYVVSPVDNQNVCLDVFGYDKSSGAEIGLYEKNGGDNQVFLFSNINGFSVLNNKYSARRLTGTKDKVYQAGNGYECQKITIEYNDDGTVCIKNGIGLYLDIEGGSAVSGGHLKFAPKSGSSSQKFVFQSV